MTAMRKTCDFLTWYRVMGHERVKFGNESHQKGGGRRRREEGGIMTLAL